MMRRIVRSRETAKEERREPRIEESRLETRRANEFVIDQRRHPLDVGRCGIALLEETVGRASAEMSAKKMPSRVMGSTIPAASPSSIHREPDGRSRSSVEVRSDGIGQLYRSSVNGPLTLCSIQFDARATSVDACARVGLGAHADGEMIGPRKGPEISRRAVLEGNRDGVRRDAVDVEAGRD